MCCWLEWLVVGHTTALKCQTVGRQQAAVRMADKVSTDLMNSYRLLSRNNVDALMYTGAWFLVAFIWSGEGSVHFCINGCLAD